MILESNHIESLLLSTQTSLDDYKIKLAGEPNSFFYQSIVESLFQQVKELTLQLEKEGSHIK